MLEKPTQLTRAIDLTSFNAIGYFCNSVAINTCKNIPSDLSSSTTTEWTLLCVAHTAMSNVRTQILLLPNFPTYARYERTLTNDLGGSNWGGGNITAQPWHRVHFVGDNYGSNFLADKTNTRNIGSSSNTWSNIYTQNAVTVVSDRNAKNSIQEIDDKVLQAWSEVQQKQYKLNGDDNWSFGYIAQDIVDAFNRYGLDYKQYNIVHEEDGKFMLKYDMCAVLESALQRKLRG